MKLKDEMIMFETDCCSGNKNKKVFYHATPYENLESIIDQGLRAMHEGVVYLTEKPDEAVRFVAIRGCKKILVACVELEEMLVEESFDHSEEFFKCKAYMYQGNIEPYKIIDYIKYEL